ncbi:membrane protein insertase YidC [Candidatus Azambacteria bacterium]|nr:membrane protein insertase YidC [Candidatus Azambacteria bacterium]
MSYLFNEIFYRPLLNGLIFLYNIIPGHDFGVAIIILTAIIRLILWPMTNKSLKNQKILAKIQPKAAEIKNKFKNNKEAQAKALMALYSENKINPLSGFLPIIIQIPILLALWQVFLHSLNSDLGSLYSFVSAPGKIQTVFLGIIDLSHKNMVLAILSGVLQYIQTKMIMPVPVKSGGNNRGPAGAPDFGSMMSKQMLYFMPVLSVIIFWSLPAALPLYWIVTTLFAILQQYLNQNERGEITKS